MSDELLAKVLAKPQDTAARAAYAAALQAKGDPRGEFIDVQIDLAKHADPKTPAAQKLAKRAAELHKRNSAKWAKPLRALGKGAKWEFKRGFVERLHLDYPCEPRLAALNDVFAVEPVTDLIAGHLDAAWWKSLFTSAGSWRLERIAVGVVGPDAQPLIKVLQSATLPNLRELRIGLVADEDLEALGEVAPPNLTHLCIGSVKTTEKGLQKLLDSPLGRKLDTLELCRSTITPRMANLICAANLKRFSASLGEIDQVEEQIKARFKKNFVLEDEPSFDYLYLGTNGISR